MAGFQSVDNLEAIWWSPSFCWWGQGAWLQCDSPTVTQLLMVGSPGIASCCLLWKDTFLCNPSHYSRRETREQKKQCSKRRGDEKRETEEACKDHKKEEVFLGAGCLFRDHPLLPPKTFFGMEWERTTWKIHICIHFIYCSKSPHDVWQALLRYLSPEQTDLRLGNFCFYFYR